MIEFEIAILLVIIGFASLITTLIVIIFGKKLEVKKEIELYDFKLKYDLFAVVYFFMIIIMFLIGAFSDFYLISFIGLLIGLIPLIIYQFVGYKKKVDEEIMNGIS